MKSHMKFGSKVYSCWNSMKQRCSNPSQDNYPFYGGRGIGYCKEWDVFENFYRDMGDPPENKQLDRIDNNRDYSPGNCRWATRIEQANNKRNNTILTLNGQSKTLAEWSRRTGVKRTTISMRINTYGWSVERALKPKTARNPIGISESNTPIQPV